MADKPASDRTEKATPERIKRAREEGQIPQAVELASAFVLVVLLITLAITGPRIFAWFTCLVQDGLTFRYRVTMDADGFSRLLGSVGAQTLGVISPLLIGAAAVSVFSGLVSGGWVFSTKAISIRWENLSPVRGLKGLFSSRAAFQTLVAIAKTSVIMWIVWRYLSDKMDVCLQMEFLSPAGQVESMSRLVFGLLLRVTVGMLVIAGADFLYQKWNYYRQLRMTKQEVKEEQRQYEVAPELKGRIRRVQYEMVRRRMLHEVPKADVVLANPTHVAVALRYDRKAGNAPVVVAKGPDLLSEKIKEIARANNVPILYRPALARAIYGSVEVGEPIGPELFVAVAEVLAMIYRLRRGALR